MNSWGEPDLKVAANITLYKIPGWIPAVIMYSVLPSTVCTKGIVIICIFEFHMHFYSFVSVSNFSSSICFIRIGSLLWAGEVGEESWHKIIWCVYIWVSKYNSYHTHLSLSHLSFILCTVVTITTSMRKAGFLTPKCPWVFLCSPSSYKWNTFNSLGCKFLQCNFQFTGKAGYH